MPDDPNFIPPDPDEPIPQPPAGGGATDAGLGGVLVTDTDEIDAAIDRLAAALADVAVDLTAGMAGAPTWSQCYKLAKSQLAKWAPGRRGENINNYTHWYYGSWSVSAAFCFIFISWVLAHAIDKTGPTVAEQNAGLQLIGGKKAYVPYIRNISGYHAGHSGMKVGAIVAVGGFEHIGFCVGVGSSTFQLLSGNSTDGSSDDAVTIKTYSLSAANGYVNLKYGTTTPQGDDDVPEYVSLGMKKPQAVKAGQAAHAVFDVEYGDGGDAHANGAYPGILSGGAHKTQFVATVEVPASAGSWRLVETDPKNDYKVTKTYPTRVGPFTENGKVEPGQHLYVELHPSADGTVNIATKVTYWKLSG